MTVSILQGVNVYVGANGMLPIRKSNSLQSFLDCNSGDNLEIIIFLHFGM